MGRLVTLWSGMMFTFCLGVICAGSRRSDAQEPGPYIIPVTPCKPSVPDSGTLVITTKADAGGTKATFDRNNIVLNCTLINNVIACGFCYTASLIKRVGNSGNLYEQLNQYANVNIQVICDTKVAKSYSCTSSYITAGHYEFNSYLFLAPCPVRYGDHVPCDYLSGEFDLQ